MKAPKKKVAINYILSLLLIGIGMWFFIPKNGLLDRAVLIASGPEWIEPTDKSAGIPVYEWLNNREVIIFKRTEDDKITLLRKQVIPAGMKRPAVPMLVSPFRIPTFLEISPNKKTLKIVYYPDSSSSESNVVSKLVSLQDGRTIEKISGLYYGVWREEDSSFWVLIYRDGLTAEIRHYDTGKKETLALKTFSGTIKEEISWETYDPSGRVIAFGKFYDAKRALIPNITVYDFNLKHLETPVIKRSFQFSKIINPDDCNISISGDRIFWEGYLVQDYFTTNILSRLPPPWKPRNRIRWIVSDLHGENMHSIAEYQDESTGDSPLDVSSEKLSPDGKYVSFIYHQGLYLLPTN